MYKSPVCSSVTLPDFPQLGCISVVTHSGEDKEISWGKKCPLKQGILFFPHLPLQVQEVSQMTLQSHADVPQNNFSRSELGLHCWKKKDISA